MKLSKTKNKLLLNHAFWGVLVLRMNFIEDPHCNPPTMWTDGVNIGFHPDYVENTSFAQLMGSLVHELFHCIYKHPLRMQGRNPDKWNRACDYAINPLIREAGFELPDWVLDDIQYHGMSAEQIYALLPDKPSDDLNFLQRVLDSIRPPDVPFDKVSQDWTIAVEQAAKTAKMRGEGSDFIDRIVQQANESVVPWQALLREFMVHPKKDNYSMRRPNRRYITSGLYLPELYSLGLGSIVIAKDISGSITDAENAAFQSETNYIMEDVSPEEIHFLYANDKVVKHEEYTAYDLPITMAQIAGGGTDFTDAFRWVEDNHINPAVFVYFTDMDGGCSAPEPWYPVIWVSTTSLDEVPFGEVIHMYPKA